LRLKSQGKPGFLNARPLLRERKRTWAYPSIRKKKVRKKKLKGVCKHRERVDADPTSFREKKKNPPFSSGRKKESIRELLLHREKRKKKKDNLKGAPRLSPLTSVLKKRGDVQTCSRGKREGKGKLGGKIRRPLLFV